MNFLAKAFVVSTMSVALSGAALACMDDSRMTYSTVVGDTLNVDVSATAQTFTSSLKGEDSPVQQIDLKVGDRQLVVFRSLSEPNKVWIKDGTLLTLIDDSVCKSIGQKGEEPVFCAREDVESWHPLTTAFYIVKDSGETITAAIEVSNFPEWTGSIELEVWSVAPGLKRLSSTKLLGEQLVKSTSVMSYVFEPREGEESKFRRTMEQRTSVPDKLKSFAFIYGGSLGHSGFIKPAREMVPVTPDNRRTLSRYSVVSVSESMGPLGVSCLLPEDVLPTTSICDPTRGLKAASIASAFFYGRPRGGCLSDTWPQAK